MNKEVIGKWEINKEISLLINVFMAPDNFFNHFFFVFYVPSFMFQVACFMFHVLRQRSYPQEAFGGCSK